MKQAGPISRRDFGAMLGSPQSCGIPDIHGMRSVRIDGCRQPDVFLAQKIFQFGPTASWRCSPLRKTVYFFVELVLLTI